MIKVAFIFADPSEKISARLTLIFTGCAAYHIGFVDTERNKFYDMNLIRRRRVWSEYERKRHCILFDAPGWIDADYLERMLDADKSRYSVLDYILFGLRPIYHLLGKSTPNAGGMICSEMVLIDLNANGANLPFDAKKAPPSPCDLFRFFRCRA